MFYPILKLVLTALLITLISEVSKRSTFIGGLLASLPLVSYLSFIWLYMDTKSVEKVAGLSCSIFWLVLPSLPFFLLLPFFLKRHWGFYASLGASTAVMVGCYFLMIFLAKKAGISI